jgi:hypothetical protein
MCKLYYIELHYDGAKWWGCVATVIMLDLSSWEMSLSAKELSSVGEDRLP